MKKQICIVTAGHVSTCPRMHKVADALAVEGCSVRWVFVSWSRDWAAFDAAILSSASWRGDPVVARGMRGALTRLRTGLRSRASRTAVDRRAPADAPTLFRAHSRAFDELRARILRQPSDLVIGGTEGGMAPASSAALARGIPYALDLEDFYGESRGKEGAREDRLARAVEDAAVPLASFCAVPSQATATAYRGRFRREFEVVHNTFPLPSRAPDLARESTGPLRLCWFSQTIGADRGLEEVVTALGMAGVSAELRLMGHPVRGYHQALRSLGERVAPRVDLTWCAPVNPERVVDWCRQSEIGLAVERTVPRNKDLSLSNKALIYPTAGLALVCTSTRGQKELMRDFGAGVEYYQEGNPAGLARIIRAWHDERKALQQARLASWEAARFRWHWDHAQERGSVLGLVKLALGAAYCRILGG